MRYPLGASWWNLTLCSRIAENTFTGMFTRPKLIARLKLNVACQPSVVWLFYVFPPTGGVQAS